MKGRNHAVTLLHLYVMLLFVFCFVVSLVISSPSFASTIAWDTASGILPDDASIPPESRFTIVNYSPFVSLQNDSLNISDTSTGLEVDIIKDDIPPILSDEDWEFEIELRMNSHDRPDLDWGAIVGVVTEDKWIMLLISETCIGFEDDGNVYLNDLTYNMDTTDAFHIYRVEKVSETVNVYVDTSDIPVFSLLYKDFDYSDFHHIRLTGSSGPGIGDFDVRRFMFSDSTPVPLPASLFLLGSGILGIAALRKRFR